MDVFEAIESRRSIRRYRPDAVSRDDMLKIVAAGVEAPSGCNVQGKQFVAIDDPAVMGRIREFSRALSTAPAAIAIVMDPKGTKFGEFWVQDASAAMQNMLLAAVDLGYGACWIEGAIRRCEEPFREILGVPDSLRVWSVMSLGTPAESPNRPPKPQAMDVIHYNRFDT